MVKYCITRPVSLIMVFLALCILGVLALRTIPISLLPVIQVPEIVVHFSRQNTSAEELENTIIEKARTDLMQVSNLVDIHSETSDGYSSVRLSFNYKTDINQAFIDVNEKIDLFMNTLPRDVERPRVVKTNSSDLPIFHLTLSLKDSLTTDPSRFSELSNFANQVIKRRLEQLPQIGFVDITGMSYQEIFIEPDLNYISSIGLNLPGLQAIIESNNLQYSPLLIEDGHLRYKLHFAVDNPVSVRDIQNLIFKHGARLFKLGDVATVGLREQSPQGYFLANNVGAINLAITKQANSRLGDLKADVHALITQFEQSYPEIKFEQMQDQTTLLEFSINSLKQDLIAGGILAFILMLFFLKNFRAPMLIAITIPVCFILCILVFRIINLSINIISLSGMILAMGLMIDNSIIVIDNITQYREKKFNLTDACVLGTNEIIRPLSSSVMTTCSVFLPLIFLSGISGAVFFDQAIAVTAGLTVSLLVSVTLLPTLYLLFHKGEISPVRNKYLEHYGIVFFERLYDLGLNWVFRNKVLAVAILIMLFCSNIILYRLLKREKLPSLRETELQVRIDWDRNISVTENRQRTRHLVESLQGYLLQSNARIGEQQYLLNREDELSSSEVELYLKAKNYISTRRMQRDIKRFFDSHYPDAKYTASSAESIFTTVFDNDEPTLLIQITGKTGMPPEQKKIDSLRLLINQEFPHAGVSAPATQKTISLNLDIEKLALYDLRIDDVYQKLKESLSTSQVGVMREGKQPIPIVFSQPAGLLEDQVKNIFVINSNGAAIPLSSLVRITRHQTYKDIAGGKDGQYVPIRIESSQPAAIISYLNHSPDINDNLDLQYTGNYFSNQALVKEMMLVLMISVLLLYFILAAQFESLIQPLIVLLELPISVSGSLIILYLFNSSINLISMIGIIVMSGIVINDSILKIDTINRLRRDGSHNLMAAIHIGGRRRLKSIIMTSLTTILSVAPFLFGSDMGSMLQRPLSFALIGGMLIGTPVSLFFIPLVYWFYYKKDHL